MSGKDINFDDKKIRKSTFYKNKTTNNIEDTDVNNILVSNFFFLNLSSSLIMHVINTATIFKVI